MVVFKINGERNSGTNFIERILSKNNLSVYVQENLSASLCKNWKHGVPVHNKEIVGTSEAACCRDDVVDIFIFRDLKEWLVSMYHNPFEMESSSDFKYFLERKQISQTNYLDFHTKKPISHDDNDKTIFEIRYHKITSILKYSECNSKIVFVSLSYLQKSPANTRNFIHNLCEKYLNENGAAEAACCREQGIISEIPHTKIHKKNIKNQTYDTNVNDYMDIINSSINHELEDFVSNLTFTMT